MNEETPGLILEHKFRDKSLLRLALTHSSHSSTNNERLEYLGDAILGFVIAEALYRKFPQLSEGSLTRLRASLVNRKALAGIARAIGLGEHLLLGPGEMRSGGGRRDSILANSLEAVIGAVYLDSDQETCKRFVLSIYEERLANLSVANLGKDPKTELQEYLQARQQQLPVYEITAEQGEAHNRMFTVSCHLAGIDRQILAQGRSKRAAEQSAAEAALKLLQS